MKTETQVIEELRDATVKAKGAKPWAKSVGVSHSYVSAVLRGDQGLGEAIWKALGYTRIKAFVFKSKIPKAMMKFEDITN